MVFEQPGEPLTQRELPEPSPADGQVLIDVSMCGVCRTDLHIFDGELDEPKLPLILGHQIVGTVLESRARAPTALRPATGSASPGSAGPTAPAVTAARAGRTCASTRSSPATTSMAAMPSALWRTSASASRSPTAFRMTHAAPLLCAGLIGYRSLRLAGEGERLGLYGFGVLRPHHLPGRRRPRLARLRPHPRGRHRDAGPGPLAGGGVGRRSGRPCGIGS